MRILCCDLKTLPSATKGVIMIIMHDSTVAARMKEAWRREGRTRDGKGQKVNCWNVGVEPPTTHLYVVLPILTASHTALLYDIATAFMIAMYAPLIVWFDCLLFS